MNLIARFTALQFLLRQTSVHGHTHPGLAGGGKSICVYNEGNDMYGNNGKMQGADFDPAGQYKYGPEIAWDAFSAWAKKTDFKSSQLPAFVKKYTTWNKGTTFETASCSSVESYELTAKFPVTPLSKTHVGPCSFTCGLPDEAPVVLFDSMQCIEDAPGDHIPLKHLEKVIIDTLCQFLWVALHSADAIQVYNFVFKVKSVEGGGASGGGDDTKGEGEKGGEASGGGDDKKGEGEKGGEASGSGDDKKGESEKKGGENGGGEYGQDKGTPPKDAPTPKETDQPPPKEAEQPPPQEAEKQPAPQQGGQQSGGPSVEHQGTQQGGQPESGDNYDKTEESNTPAPPASRCTLRQ
ncbi:hypothetical protein ABG067_005268 [Albugo candida]